MLIFERSWWLPEVRVEGAEAEVGVVGSLERIDQPPILYALLNRMNPLPMIFYSDYWFLIYRVKTQEQNADDAARQKAKKWRQQKEKGEVEPKLPKYRDRARERRDGANPDYEESEAQMASGFHAVPPPDAEGYKYLFDLGPMIYVFR